MTNRQKHFTQSTPRKSRKGRKNISSAAFAGIFSLRPLREPCLLRETYLDEDTRNWTVEEIENTINYLTWINKNFGAADATAIINNLVKDYGINLSHINI